MKKPPSDCCRSRLIGSSLVLLVALAACGKLDDGKTAGQQLDTAIAKTGQAAEKAKTETERAMAKAGTAMKDATQEIEASGKEIADKAGNKLNDITITAAVSSGLSKDPELSALKINVETKRGTVILTGSAPTEAARARAGTIAQGVKGVDSVDNRLTVKAG